MKICLNLPDNLSLIKLDKSPRPVFHPLVNFSDDLNSRLAALEHLHALYDSVVVEV